jgi:hypothetical protein
MTILPSILLLTSVITCCCAQTPIKPGDKLLRYDWIKPSRDFDRCVISDTAGNVKYDFMMEAYTRIDTQKNKSFLPGNARFRRGTLKPIPR